ncbi:MAG TPA: class I SAM-dependent methyltransferase [Ilumatobacteraceae bacterium]|nr:class I SAM-dependent methyltransferase [Ilumatobacteraceae bacterium]
MTDGDLVVVLAALRERGAIGESSLPGAIAHAASFAEAVPRDATVIDLGSGGGLPGLVIAVRRPDVRITLVDRRERRTDLVRLAVAQLGVQQRVEVVTADVLTLAKQSRYKHAFDVVTARSFARRV